MGPVAIVVNHKMQEDSLGDARPAIPRLSPTIPPQGSHGAVREAAQLLVDARTPGDSR